jgi:hypothetical protein
VVLLSAAAAQGALVLEFFAGTSVNDTVINLGSPLSAVNVPAGGSAFVQVVLRQTAPTNLLDATDGLSAYLVQANYGPGQAGVYRVPATVSGGTTPQVNVANPGVYSLVRAFRPAGTNENTATGVRFGGLNLNPPPSPSVDANGRIFLGTSAQACAIGIARLQPGDLPWHMARQPASAAWSCSDSSQPAPDLSRPLSHRPPSRRRPARSAFRWTTERPSTSTATTSSARAAT